MIENCITDSTDVFEICVDNLIEFNETDVDRFNAIANNISEETGVPKCLIYTAPYFFFIDRWHKIDGQWYFYKSDDYDAHFVNELMGEVISEYFGLETAHFMVAKRCVLGEKDEYGVVSKNFCDLRSTYRRSWEYGFPAARDLSILERLRGICSTEEEYLLLLGDMKSFFVRDFYTSQIDRTGNNFLFKCNDEGIRLAPLYDYENSFEAMDKFRYRNEIGELNLENPKTRILFRKDAEFQRLFGLLMDASMARFIEQVQDRHKILVPNYMKAHYKDEDTEIKRLVLKHRII